MQVMELLNHVDQMAMQDIAAWEQIVRRICDDFRHKLPPDAHVHNFRVDMIPASQRFGYELRIRCFFDQGYINPVSVNPYTSY